MKKFILLVFISFFAISCKNNPKNPSNNNKELKAFPEVNEQFDSYLDNFERRFLPINIYGCRVNPEELKELDSNKYQDYISESSFAFYQIPTNGIYIATINLRYANCLLPELSTYKLNGDLIDRKTISIGYCSFEPGFSCTEYMSIKKDFSIYIVDSISSFELDETGRIIPETTRNYIIYKTGKLMSDGKIILSEEKKKNLRN